MGEYLKNEYIAIYVSILNIVITVFLAFKVEGVQNSYNKSLESHKIDLQKEFEHHKIVLKLCNEIDKELINKLVSCKKEIARDRYDIIEYGNTGGSRDSLDDLHAYLMEFSNRYEDNDSVKQFVACYNEIELLCKDTETWIPDYDGCIIEIEKPINSLLSIFLPRLN